MGWTIDNALRTLEEAIEDQDWKKVKAVREKLNSGEIIFSEWSYKDVLIKAEEMSTTLTKEQAMEILSNVEHKHNASLGINWDVIQAHIENYV